VRPGGGEAPATLKVSLAAPDETSVERPLLPAYAANGGFPEPPAGGKIHVVAARHPACGASTRIRLPATVPSRAVHHLHCSGCGHDFDVLAVAELGIEDPRTAPPVRRPAPAAATARTTSRATPRRPSLRAPRLRRPAALPPRIPISKPKLPSGLGMPKLRFDPQSLSWKVVSIAVAAVLVIVGLLALRGGGDSPTRDATASAATSHHQAKDHRSGSHNSSKSHDGGHRSGAKDAHLVAGVSYSFALPAGWERIDPPSGATYAAQAKDGGADATLWITEDPKLDFPTFVSQSLSQLEALAGSAQIVDRVPAPTAEDTIVRLAADAPAGQPSYEATLRVAGPYRYYLATSVQPDASNKATDGADLIAGSFTPDLGG